MKIQEEFDRKSGKNPVDIRKYNNDIFCILPEYPLLY